MTQSAHPLLDLKAALLKPRVGPLLVSRFVFFLAFVIFQSIFPLYALERFGFEAHATAYVFSYIGFLIVLVQGAAIGRLTARFTERQLLVGGVALMAAALAAWAWAPTVPALLAVLPFIALAGGTDGTVNSSVISQSGGAGEVGGMMGLSASVEAMTRIVGPALGGALIERLGPAAPGLFGGAVLLGLLPYAWTRFRVTSRRRGA